MNGKGSKPRPLSVGHEQFASNWERVFNRKSEQARAESQAESESTDSRPA